MVSSKTSPNVSPTRFQLTFITREIAVFLTTNLVRRHCSVTVFVEHGVKHTQLLSGGWKILLHLEKAIIIK